MRIFLSSLFLFLLATNSFPQERINRKDTLDLAAVFKEAMEYETAIGILESALKVKEEPRLKRMLAVLFYLNGETRKAIDIFKSLKKKGWQEFVYLGLAFEDLGAAGFAIDNYLKSNFRKENSIALYRLGKIFYHAKKYKKAAKYFRKIIAFDPSIRPAYYYLADCLLKGGDNREAHYYFSKAAYFYPENKEIKNKISALKDRLGEEFFAAEAKKTARERKEVELFSYRREESQPAVRVGIGRGAKAFTFRCGGKFIVSDRRRTFTGEANRFYTLSLSRGQFILTHDSQKQSAELFDSPVKISSLSRRHDALRKFPFYLLGVTYGKGNFWHKQIDRAYRGELEAVANTGRINLINRLSIEEYLYGVLPNEISPKAPFEALKAQAIAARTFALKNLGRHKKEGFDFCPDVHCQVYQGLSAENPRTTRAVKETEKKVLIYRGKPIEAFYHSNSGGCLAADLFGKRGYLANRFDCLNGVIGRKAPPDFSPSDELGWFYAYPKTLSSFSRNHNFRWQRIYDAEDFYLTFGFSLRDLISLSPLAKGDCFRYQTIELKVPEGKIVLKGDSRIREYFGGLKSSAFRIELKSSRQGEPEMLIIWGAGFGHAVGLSQEGAVRMAGEGYRDREILKHYYPYAKVKKMTGSYFNRLRVR